MIVASGGDGIEWKKCEIGLSHSASPPGWCRLPPYSTAHVTRPWDALINRPANTCSTQAIVFIGLNGATVPRGQDPPRQCFWRKRVGLFAQPHEVVKQTRDEHTRCDWRIFRLHTAEKVCFCQYMGRARSS